MTTPRAILRRRFLAERGSQLQVILWFLLHLLIYTVLTLGIIMLPSALRLVTDGFTLEEQYAASQDFLFLDLRVVPILLTVPLLGVVHFVFITHRIFGPLVRLKRVLRQWREQGAWPATMRVRRGDFHAVLFDEFSQSAAALGADVAAARELVRRAADRARALATPAGSADIDAGARAVAEECRLALERLDRWQQ